MGRHLVLVGGGHAHAGILLSMSQLTGGGHHVTLINPTKRHYYSGMGPGVLGGYYTPDQISFPVQDIVTAGGGEFIEDKIVGIDAQAKTVALASGDSVAYDVLSLNVGSGIPIVGDSAYGVEQSVYPVKPIWNLWAAREDIARRLEQGDVRVVVVGGGPAALEVAGNAKAVTCGGRTSEVMVMAGRKFLRNVPSKVRKLALDSFWKRGIIVDETGYVERVAPGLVATENQREITADVILSAMGVRPPSLLQESGVRVGPDGGLLVNEFLQSVDHPDIFGGGDCIHFAPQPLDKVGVYAVRQHPVLINNLAAQLEGRDLQAFDTGGKYLLVYNLGDGTGIFSKWGLAFGGKAAFRLKDYIDRKFMKLFIRNVTFSYGR